MARKLIAEAAKRGSRVTYEDIYGVVTEPVVKPKPRVSREISSTRTLTRTTSVNGLRFIGFLFFKSAILKAASTASSPP